APGESYHVVGFGAVDGAGDGAGLRRRSDEQPIACVGVGCGGAELAAGEWLGGAGSCHGDSGGPALDAGGRVIGIDSRGGAECTPAVFSGFDRWGPWLAAT